MQLWRNFLGMSKTLVVVGAGGHAKVVMDVARLNGYDEFFILDDNKKGQFNDCSIVGTTKEYPLYLSYNFIIAIGNNEVREKIADNLKNVHFATLIHPSAVVSDRAVISEGTVVFPLAVINSGAIIGKHCIINSGAIVEHDCIIKDFVHVSPNATICGTVVVGKKTHIGAGATVINNLSIADDVVVGAGAVVTKDIDEKGIFVGIPAKKLEK